MRRRRTPLERRQKVNRRRQIDPTTCERDYTDQEVEFMNALDEYKRKSGRMFPTCSEVLEVIASLGYVKLSANELGRTFTANERHRRRRSRCRAIGRRRAAAAGEDADMAASARVNRRTGLTDTAPAMAGLWHRGVFVFTHGLSAASR